MTVADILWVSFNLLLTLFKVINYILFLGPDLRASFESTRSFVSHAPRGYSSMNEEWVANQDALLQQVRTLIKLSQQNQVALNRIQQALEQNGIKLNMSQEEKEMKTDLTIPEKSATGGS
jgi:hypothetical protein